MSRLSTISAREASIFACLTETVVAPQPPLPPVRETDAALFFDRWMSRSPRLNRVGLRALLHLVELAPLVLGFRRRLRALSPAERAAWIERTERSTPAALRPLTKLLKGMALLAYYGDDAVMLEVGYDAEANVRRARELRIAEARP